MGFVCRGRGVFAHCTFVWMNSMIFSIACPAAGEVGFLVMKPSASRGWLDLCRSQPIRDWGFEGFQVTQQSTV